MFAGHVGVALAIGRAERRVNLGLLVFAALWLDVLLWLLVLLGWESVSIRADFAETHQPHFEFAFSHGLAAATGWTLLAALGTGALRVGPTEQRRRTAAWIGAAVLSHWVLDVIVHRPELPLAGSGSIGLGLGLWQRMPIALLLESAILVLGLWLFLSASALSTPRKLGVAAIALAVGAFTVLGMTVAPAPPSAAAMAGSSLATIALLSALFGWVSREKATRTAVANA